MAKIFTKANLTAMHTEIEATCKRVRKLIRVREITVSHRLIEEMNHLQLLEKLAACRRNISFDRIQVQDEGQQRSQGHVCPVDDPKHCQTDEYFDPRRSTTPHKFTASMWAAVNVLKQESLLSRSPPQQPCHVSRVVTVKKTTVELSLEEEYLLHVCVYEEGEIESRMEPEQRALKSLRVSTGPQVPR